MIKSNKNLITEKEHLHLFKFNYEDVFSPVYKFAVFRYETKSAFCFLNYFLLQK